MNRSALILFPLLLAGCNVQAKHDGAKGDDNVTISGDAEGNVSFDLPVAKGQVKLPEGALSSSDIDIDGVKMPPSASVNSFHVEATGGRSIVNIGFKDPNAPEKVRAYFADEFRERKVEAAVTGDTITGTSKDGDKFTIKVGPGEGGGAKGTIRLDGADD
ncbi:MAG TPA: hypothetical protein VIL42_01505 [Sphingomicrobium sp.]